MYENESVRLVYVYCQYKILLQIVFFSTITLIICYYFHIYTCLLLFFISLASSYYRNWSIYTYNIVIIEECGYRDFNVVVVVIVKETEKKEETPKHAQIRIEQTHSHIHKYLFIINMVEVEWGVIWNRVHTFFFFAIS